MELLLVFGIRLFISESLSSAVARALQYGKGTKFVAKVYERMIVILNRFRNVKSDFYGV